MTAVADAPPIDPAEVWVQLVRADEYLKLEALLTAQALSDLVDSNMEVKISQRSLSDAVGRPDLDDARSKFVRTGVRYLIRQGWVQLVNPDAPRRERGHYRLTVPLTRLPL